jgi:acetyl-CoA synthetase
LWHHGDWAERDGDRWYIRGRSDDTLKIAGKRIGPAEIESVVNSLDGVIESAAVGVADGIKGDALVVFARLNDDTASDQQRLDKLISDTVVAQLGPALRPREVHVVSTLPRTRSGKILRRVIRAVYCGEPPGDVSSIEDLSAVGVIEALR